MTSRRGFLSAAAGIVFCGCCLRAGAQTSPSGEAAPAASPPKRPVVIKGRHVKTIDVHSHCLFREAVALLPSGSRTLTPNIRNAQEAYLAIDDRLRAMDDMAIEMEVLSINPFWYGLDPDLAAKIVQIQNEKLAELCAARPDRFAAFASLTLQDPSRAVQELERAVTKLGLRGAAIGDRVESAEFSDPKFHPVWAQAEDLGAVLFIHPQGVPELNDRLKGNGWLGNTIGNPLGTTIALQHLIFEGTLDRYPELKVLAAHGGGYLGSYAPRDDHACFVAPAFCDPKIKLKKQPTEYLNQLYFDALVFTPEALRHLVAQVGASQVMLGSDHPYVWEQHPVDHVLATSTLTDVQKVAILGGNAIRLFKLKGEVPDVAPAARRTRGRSTHT
jgi:aminocarboxymuconate-semialdehyde decarboxylase